MNYTADRETPGLLTLRFGFFVAIATFIVTLGTFIIAFNTPPLSGPFCRGGCFEYPYHDIASRFPRDYYWMYSAMLFVLVYLVFMVCIHYFPFNNRKIFSHLSLLLAAMASVILFSTYFVQVSVIQPSLLNNETDGISILTQFNPHGHFIAMEEAGFILINLSLLSLVPVFSGKGNLEKALRITLFSGFVLALISFIVISIQYGIMRDYIYEVTIISIVWLELIVSSVLLAILYNKNLKACGKH